MRFGPLALLDPAVLLIVAGIEDPLTPAPPAFEPLSRGTATAPDPLPSPPRRWSDHAGRSGASRRMTAPPAPPHGLAPELPDPIEPLDDEDELEEPEDGDELELLPLDELPSLPRGTAEPTVSPVFGRDCAVAHEGATTLHARAAATVPIVHA